MRVLLPLLTRSPHSLYNVTRHLQRDTRRRIKWLPWLRARPTSSLQKGWPTQTHLIITEGLAYPDPPHHYRRAGLPRPTSSLLKGWPTQTHLIITEGLAYPDSPHHYRRAGLPRPTSSLQKGWPTQTHLIITEGLAYPDPPHHY